MQVITWLTAALASVTAFINSVLYFPRPLFVATGIFATRKFKKAQKFHKYAIMIAARNEETVIGNLIQSINEQDYPSELVDVFVVADNCTDNTAKVSRQLGAYCYERSDDVNKTKGFALQFLVERIREDFGIEAYEGYFIFDADNLLKSDYISRMNDSFDSGEKIVTSYRNTKNFDDNWIAASYGIHWLRTVRGEHRGRSLFHLATRIQGTGFLFASEIIKNGWNYTSLTEDRAFCADAVANGYKISYNNDAVFYDEQPVDMKIVMRQRIRWAKGHLQAFVETGGKLIKHIFITNGMANKGLKVNWFKRLINNLRLRFMSFDMFSVVFPNSIVGSFEKVLGFVLKTVLIIIAGQGLDAMGYVPDFLKELMGFSGGDFITRNCALAILYLALYMLVSTVFSCLGGIVTAIYVFVLERKRIVPIKWYKKVWYCITFPIFDLIGKLSMIIALFKKVEWKPIPHNSKIDISNINKRINK